MDLVIAETQDNMINSLQIGLPESAAYITDRKQFHFPSISGNSFSSKNGNKHIKLLFQVKTTVILICPVFVDFLTL